MFSIIYLKIKNGQTKIDIAGDKNFKEDVLNSIALLLTRPAGRQLIFALIHSPQKICIGKGAENTFVQNAGWALLCFNNEEKSSLYVVDPVSKKRMIASDTPLHISFGHELIHLVHHLHYNRLSDGDAVEKAMEEEALNKDYTDLEELYTITGVQGESVLCENMLRYEFGLFPRYGHISPEFAPFTKKDLPHIDEKGASQLTRLEMASADGIVDEVRQLLYYGARAGNAFLLAIERGHLEILQLFVDKMGSKIVNASYSAEQTTFSALHQVAANGKVEVLSFLLKNRADVDVQREDSMTALHLACREGRLECVKLLMDSGANTSIAAQGMTAMDFAIAHGHYEVVAFLLKHGADLSLSSLQNLFKGIKNPINKCRIAHLVLSSQLASKTTYVTTSGKLVTI